MLITSRDNPGFRALRALAQNAHARREQQQTLLEGGHLVDEAIQAGVELLCLILAEDTEDRWWGELPDTPRMRLKPGLMRELSSLNTPPGVMAQMRIPHKATAPDPFVLLLEAIQEPGNLGALLRTAAAAGVDTVYFSHGSAEAWSPKALRGGQGAQFRLRIVEHADLLALAQKRPVWAALAEAKTPLYELDLQGPVAFAFGNEGAGLSPELQSCCRGFTIPMPGGTESLNVAAAAAIALFERVRQTQASLAG
jgi:TrmH family RNA methyltransferase